MRIFFLVVLLLAGCATSDSIAWDKAIQQTKSGQCTDALRTIDNIGVEFKHTLLMKGYVYGECRGSGRDMNKAWAYITLAARYGETRAIDALVEAGKPVPPADLAGTTKRQLTMGEAALLGISQGIEDYNKNQPPPSSPVYTDIDCKRVSKDKVNCSGYSR